MSVLSDRQKSVSIDRALIPKSYRDYLDILKGMGELIEIDDEVDWYLELGAIFRHSAETLAPGAIFNNVKGCPPGFRAADFGMGKSGTPGQPWGRLAIMLGLPPDTDLMSIQHAYLDAMDTGRSSRHAWSTRRTPRASRTSGSGMTLTSRSSRLWSATMVMGAGTSTRGASTSAAPRTGDGRTGQPTAARSSTETT